MCKTDVSMYMCRRHIHVHVQWETYSMSSSGSRMSWMVGGVTGHMTSHVTAHTAQMTAHVNF